MTKDKGKCKLSNDTKNFSTYMLCPIKPLPALSMQNFDVVVHRTYVIGAHSE